MQSMQYSLHPLTQDLFVKIDLADLALIQPYKWQAEKHRHTYYAGTSVKINGRWKRIRIHRFLMKAKPGEIVDHINGDGLDNRRENLRITSASVNSRNRRKSKDLTSRYLGVHYCASRKKWAASIKLGPKYKNLGRYSTEMEASLAYQEALKHVEK